MGRLHLFEFEDQQWFPSFLRNYMTDFLQHISNVFDIYKPIVPIIEKGLELSHSNVIVDLASGGGGGILKLNEHLLKNNPSLKIILTDYYPNVQAFEQTKKSAHNIEYITSSKAYCERGMQYDLSTVTDAHLSDLCDALDVLTENGYPSYNVVLRAIVHVDTNDLGEDFIFPSEWEQYDRTGDEDLVIRLDTVMQVNASTKDDAIKVAKDSPVSLGLDDICCNVEHWVDEDQADDIQLNTE